MTLAQKRVLVVEDDPKTSDIVRAYLENEGYAVVSAFDGVEGINAARAVSPGRR